MNFNYTFQLSVAKVFVGLST